MIYLKSSVGIEMREGDLVISCLKSNFSAGVFTYFKRITGFEARDKQELRKELDRLFKSQRLSRDSIVLGVPRKDTIVRQLDLPKEVEGNLKQVIQYQVQAFEPSEEDKYYYDYSLMRGKEPAGRLQILLVLIRKVVLDGYLASLKELGLQPSTVTIGSIALANLFLQGHPNGAGKTYVVGDLKPKEVEFLAVRNGALLYTREASRGETQGWKEFLLHELELAAGRIRLGPEDSIEKVVLAGEESESAHREVRDQIEDCDLIGSHVRFEMLDAQRAHLQEGATSIGLAYSGIMRRPGLRLNLLPAERRLQQTRWAYVPSIVLGLVVLALLVALALRPMIQERIMVRKLDEEIQSLKGRADRVQTLRSQTEAMEKRLLNIEGLLRTQDMNLEILQELTALLPPDTFLNLYQNRDGTIQITGSSSSASDLVAKLERSPLLKGVNQKGTIFKDAQTGKDRFNFEAKLERNP